MFCFYRLYSLIPSKSQIYAIHSAPNGVKDLARSEQLQLSTGSTGNSFWEIKRTSLDLRTFEISWYYGTPIMNEIQEASHAKKTSAQLAAKTHPSSPCASPERLSGKCRCVVPEPTACSPRLGGKSTEKPTNRMSTNSCKHPHPPKKNNNFMRSSLISKNIMILPLHLPIVSS